MPPDVAAVMSTFAPIAGALMTTLAPDLSSKVVNGMNTAMQNATKVAGSMGDTIKGVINSGAPAATEAQDKTQAAANTAAGMMAQNADSASTAITDAMTSNTPGP